MFASTNTVAFCGIDILQIKTEVKIMNGQQAFTIVGLGDKAITESKERVRAALNSIGLELPEKRITVNLAPADIIKEGTHYDLPITMALIASMGIIDPKQIQNYLMMGEVGLDASIRPINGVLLGAVSAKNNQLDFICPASQLGEANLSKYDNILAPSNILSLLNFFKLGIELPVPEIAQQDDFYHPVDMSEVKGQKIAKRAMEIAAVGGHNMLMSGPPGAGKSMLASRFSTILPSLTESEMLQISQIHSVAGELKEGHLITHRPFRSPHHSATGPAIIGGGTRVKPGEISLSHNGVLFLDELPEFQRVVLESLRQPLETGVVSVSRANAHVTYPARFQLIAAMNPCKCGMLGTHGLECAKAPNCGADYQAKISGPLLDRIDLYVQLPAVNPWELASEEKGESSSVIAERVKMAINFQQDRFKNEIATKNAHAEGALLDKIAPMTDDARALLQLAAEKFILSARGYHRVIKVARSIADLDQQEIINKNHIAEAVSFRNTVKRK